VGVLLYA